MSSEIQLECPLCGVTAFEKRFTKKDRDFYRCQTCDLELQYPLPTRKELEEYYDRSFADGMYQEFAAAGEMKRMTASQRLKEIVKYLPLQGKWLDVGCANGVFVEAAAERGIESEGIELSQHAVQIGRDRGLQLHMGTVDELPEGETFDCVTGFDVLEHVLEPNSFLDGIHERLNEGGYIVLTVPNTGGIVRRLMGQRWFFYIPEEHLHYFNRRNLVGLLKAHGFDILNVGATYKPMTYDYAMTQFAEYNPLIFKLLKTASYLIPSALRTKPIPQPIGELRIVGRKMRKPVDTSNSPTHDSAESELPTPFAS